MLLTALSPKFTGVMESRDPDGSAKLPGQGPIRLTKYWPEVKDYMITSLPRPMAGSETEFYVVADDIFCLGATRTPVANISQLLFQTRTVNPDNFIACRYATLVDILDILDAIIRPYMGNIPGACGPGGLPVGVNPDSPQIGAFPGTVVHMIGGYQFIRPTLNGDEYEVAPFTKEDADNVREIAALLAICRGAVVLLPPPAAKFGLDPVFDEVTAEIAKIL